MIASTWRIEALTRDHDRACFDCGDPALNEFLARFARQNQDSGLARTFVAVSPEEPLRLAGYYSLTVGAISRENLPASAAKRLPAFPLPIARLARLAVDRARQGRALGEHLLMDALARCLRVAEDVGLLAVVIDAKHERARAFYARYEFDSLPDQPLTLWLPLPALRRLFEATQR